MEFIFPYHQWPLWGGIGAAAIAVLYAALRRLERRREQRLSLFAESAVAQRLLVGYSAAVRRPLMWFTLAGFICLGVALAQPHMGDSWVEIDRVSRDVIICFDVSESMRATDIAPDRLFRAKHKTSLLLDRLRGDRFGLVAFSGAAQLVCPLTTDHGYFRAVLNSLDTSTISLKGTDIAAAIQTAVDTFRSDLSPTGQAARENRAIIVISDGEQISGDAVLAAKEAAKVAHVYTMGIGDPSGAVVALPDWMAATYQLSTREHLSQLDEDTLMQMARAGNGLYVRSTGDNWDIDQLTGRIQELSARAVAGEQRLRRINRYQWPLALAVAFFFAEGAWLAALPHLREWRKERRSRQEAAEYA